MRRKRVLKEKEMKRERQSKCINNEGINNVAFVQKEPYHFYFNFHKLSTKIEYKSKSH